LKDLKFILKEIVDTFGNEIFFDSRRLKAALSDYNAQKKLSVPIAAIVESGALNEIIKTRPVSLGERAQSILTENIAEETGYDESLALEIVRATLFANGIEVAENETVKITPVAKYPVAEPAEKPGRLERRSVPRGNSNGNVVNNGLALLNKEIYYVTSYGNILCGKKLICKDDCLELNKVGDWIFYKNFSDGGTVYKINAESGERIKLSDDKASYINVLGEYIYYRNYSDGDSIYRMKTDGSERARLFGESALFLNVVGEWIYYVSWRGGVGIYKIKTDGTGWEKINSDMASSLNVTGKAIYYQNVSEGGKLYKQEKNQRIKITDDPSFNINVVGDWIYYSNGADNRSVYKINSETGEKIKLNNERSFDINLAGPEIYYRSVK
jgi:hypothetical protein